MPSSRSNHQAGGFTLIEVLVVLVILGLLVGLVVSRGPPRSAALGLQAAAGQVVEALRAARAQAIAGNRPVTVGFDAATHSYRPPGGADVRLPAALGFQVLGRAGAGDARVAGISFGPDGSSSGGRILFSEGTLRRDIVVDWLTGRVRNGP